MSFSLKRFVTVAAITVSPFMLCIEASKAASFNLIDATVSDINSAFDSGILTSEKLVNLYIDRINTFDKVGSTPLNSIVTINPQAVETAKALDIERQTTGARSPLHGIPIIVKDNYDTFDLPTTGGSLSLAGSIPPNDAFQVRKLREAGAIVLAKSNMAEFAFSPNETVSSILGTTRNPYDLNRVPAGSSGGTAASVAANFGTLGLGTDTGNSIRGPSSHTALVGIRSTIGLTSRDGIVPLFLPRDIGGPMVRTVEDAALVLSTIAGYDPADPSTEAVKGVDLPDYTTFLNAKGLEGSRIGVVDQLFRPTAENDFTSTADAEIVSLMDRAIADLTGQGATVESVGIPNLTDLFRASFDGGNTFNYDINRYLESRGPDVPVKTLDDIIESGLFDPSIKNALLNAAEVGDVPPESRDNFLAAEAARERMREVVLSIIDSGEYDALIYPTWSNPPRLVGDLESPSGNNSFQIAPPTGFPALTVPMGFTVNDTLPAGLQFLGRPFDEGQLIELAYSYEQSTQYRRPPALFPALAGDKFESESIPEPGMATALVVLGVSMAGMQAVKRRSQGAIDPMNSSQSR